jgi:DNA-binding CsgD family transcriptional regulator
METAVLTVGPTLRVGFTNPAAETLLRVGDGLRLRNGHLTTSRPADERVLAAAVSVACNRTDQTNSATPRRACDLIRIFRDDVHPPYRACVFPLKPGHAVCGLASVSQAVLFVDDPNQDAIPGDLISRAFQLTPAEARLAVHLTSGSTLSDAADVLGVTYNTVRAQLRAIFDKTATHRQTELVRLLQTCRSLRVSLS